MNDAIRVEQTLHGYANGHQLLASSVNLNAEDKRLMDELSDLSGICEEKNFIDYYTGYPIANGKKYVIAKTWYAHEKQRPGCVWTQSLILNTEDVGSISCMKQFEKLFVRPTSNAYDRYTDTLLYQDTGKEIPSQYDMKKLQYVIYTVFSSSKPRYVYADGTHLEEEILLVVKNLPGWILKQFSFCTMAYDTRRIGEREFSYQIIGRYKADRDIKRIHLCESLSMIIEYPLWISEYCKYIQKNYLYLLHNYMEQYGEEYKNFSEYSAMARLYFAVNNTENITLEEYFKYSDIVRKQTDKSFYEKTMELILDEKVNLFEGKEYEIWDMLELKKIKLKANYQKILNEKTIKNSPEKLYPVLQSYITGKLSSHMKKTVENLIVEIKPEHLKKVSMMNENICVVLINQNNRLLLAKDIWKESKKFQQTILSASSRVCSNEILEKLIYIILKYDKESIADTLFTVYGDKIIPYIYISIKKENIGKNIDIETWKKVLLKDQKSLLKNILYFQDTKMIENLFLDIDTYQEQNIHAIDCETWKKLYIKMKEEVKQNTYLATQFLPVILMTDYLDEAATEIIRPIYQALETDNLPFEQWNKIQSLLPEVEAYQSWDKCLRVRLALEKKGVSVEKCDKSFSA